MGELSRSAQGSGRALAGENENGDGITLTRKQRELVGELLGKIHNLALNNSKRAGRLRFGEREARELRERGRPVPSGMVQGDQWARRPDAFQFFVIEGDRGTGKSTVVRRIAAYSTLLGAAARIAASANDDPDIRKVFKINEAPERHQDLGDPGPMGRDSVFALKTIYPDMFHEREIELPDILFDQIRRDLRAIAEIDAVPPPSTYRYGDTGEMNEPFPDEDFDRSPPDRSKVRDAKRLLDELARDIDPAWTFARNIGRDVVSRDAVNFREFVQEKGRYSSLSTERHLLWQGFLEKYLDFKRAELLLVTLDDCDLSAKIAEQLLNELRLYLNHPRVVVVMAMDMAALRRVVRAVHYQDSDPVLEALGRLGSWRPRRSMSGTAPSAASQPDDFDLDRRAERLLHSIFRDIEAIDQEVAQQVAKILPPARRFKLLQNEWSDLLRILFSQDRSELEAQARQLPNKIETKSLKPLELYVFLTRHIQILHELSLRDISFIREMMGRESIGQREGQEGGSGNSIATGLLKTANAEVLSHALGKPIEDFLKPEVVRPGDAEGLELSIAGHRAELRVTEYRKALPAWVVAHVDMVRAERGLMLHPSEAGVASDAVTRLNAGAPAILSTLLKDQDVLSASGDYLPANLIFVGDLNAIAAPLNGVRRFLNRGAPASAGKATDPLAPAIARFGEIPIPLPDEDLESRIWDIFEDEVGKLLADPPESLSELDLPTEMETDPGFRQALRLAAQGAIHDRILTGRITDLDSLREAKTSVVDWAKLRLTIDPTARVLRDKPSGLIQRTAMLCELARETDGEPVAAKIKLALALRIAAASGYPRDDVPAWADPFDLSNLPRFTRQGPPRLYGLAHAQLEQLSDALDPRDKVLLAAALVEAVSAFQPSSARARMCHALNAYVRKAQTPGKALDVSPFPTQQSWKKRPYMREVAAAVRRATERLAAGPAVPIDAPEPRWSLLMTLAGLTRPQAMKVVEGADQGGGR